MASRTDIILDLLSFKPKCFLPATNLVLAQSKGARIGMDTEAQITEFSAWRRNVDSPLISATNGLILFLSFVVRKRLATYLLVRRRTPKLNIGLLDEVLTIWVGFILDDICVINFKSSNGASNTFAVNCYLFFNVKRNKIDRSRATVIYFLIYVWNGIRSIDRERGET